GPAGGRGRPGPRSTLSPSAPPVRGPSGPRFFAGAGRAAHARPASRPCRLPPVALSGDAHRRRPAPPASGPRTAATGLPPRPPEPCHHPVIKTSFHSRIAGEAGPFRSGARMNLHPARLAVLSLSIAFGLAAC